MRSYLAAREAQCNKQIHQIQPNKSVFWNLIRIWIKTALFDSYLNKKANIWFGFIWKYLFVNVFCAIFDSYSYLVFVFATFYYKHQVWIWSITCSICIWITNKAPGCVLCFKRGGYLQSTVALLKTPLQGTATAEHMGKYIWSPSNIWFEVFVFVSRWPVIWFGLIWSISPIFDSYLEQIPNLFDIWVLHW